MDKFDIKTITLDYMLTTPLGEDLVKLKSLYEKVQENIYSMVENDDPDKLKQLKMGTILTFAVIGKVIDGKNPRKFSKEDWQDIAEAVSEYAIIMDGKDYSVFVFSLYSRYIDGSANYLEAINADEKQLEEIRALALDIQDKTEALKNDEISETAYIESCMWTSLEAMIKLLSAWLGTIMKGMPEYYELLHAAAMFAFEYGRLKLWSKEQALLEEYIEKQYILDEELQAKLDAFNAELAEEADMFNNLVDMAFDPDFRAALMGSVELARVAGVDEDEILNSVEEIDEFFID